MSVSHSLYALLTTPQHYRRLFALDLNVQHFANENFKNIGQWFTNKYKTLTQRETSARDAFSRCCVTAATAREQWQLQVAAQTAAQPRMFKASWYSFTYPLSGQSKHAAEKLVSSLLLLRLDLNDAEQHLQALQARVPAPDNDDNDVDDAGAAVNQLRSRIRRSEAVLGASFAGITLHQAAADPFLAARLAAHGLKERLLRRICARKFELSRLEQHLGRPALGTLADHSQQSIL
jgi:hypothetical protein